MRASSDSAQRQRRRWENSRGPRLSAASLVFIGFIIGISFALYYAWIAEPVVFTEASPARLSARYQAEYILLVSQSFDADNNWPLAQERLEALSEPDLAQRVAAQLEAFLRDGRPAAELQSLARLAQHLGAGNAAVAVFAPPPTPTLAFLATAPAASVQTGPDTTRLPTNTPLPTFTSTPAPSPTSVPAYRLLRQEQVCSLTGPVDRLEVVAVDSFLEPLPGAEVLIEWDGGQDHFFTGFKPEFGLGYGDFTMQPEISYSAWMADGSQIITGLRLEPCPLGEGGLLGGWRLTFQNTDVVQDSNG